MEVQFNNKGWSRKTIYRSEDCGSSCLFGPATVGSVGTSGANSIYFSDGTGRIFEYHYQNDSWSVEQIGADGFGVDALAIGDLRGDGIQRLYSSGPSSIYEFSP